MYPNDIFGATGRGRGSAENQNRVAQIECNEFSHRAGTPNKLFCKQGDDKIKYETDVVVVVVAALI